jgi:exosortase/archaeosortase family protein
MRSKVLFALSSFFIFFVVNIIRLYVVVLVVNSYGSSAFYLVHDIGGNLLLIATGAVIFLTYLGKCSAK